MKTNLCFLTVFILLVACVPAVTEPSTLPTITAAPTQIPATPTTVASANPEAFSECPLPANEGTAGKLRLVYVTNGNLWLLDEGREPVLMMDSGDVEQVMLSPDGSKIVLARQRDADTVEIWVVDSSGWRNLSGDQNIPGSVEFISFSDDAQFVAFENGELWAADVMNARVFRLVSQEVLRAQAEVPSDFPVSPDFVTWIPGTHQLTFTPIHGYPPDLGGDAIPFPDPVLIVDAGTGEQSLLFPKTEGGYITFSPDGKTMVIANANQLRLSRVEEPGRPRTIINYTTICELDCFIAQPAWMPDSSSFLLELPSEGMNPDNFLNGFEEPFTIWSVSKDGSIITKLGEFFRLPGTFSISPDRKRVAYFRREITRNLHIANADGSEDIPYASNQDWAFHGWAPDSQHFAYQAYQDTLVMYGDICGEPNPLTNMVAIEFIGWLDGTRFLMLAGRSGAWELYLGVAGGKNTKLVEFGSSIIYDHIVMPE